MTEAEWLTSTDPAAMLAEVRGRVSDRKLRLFACACLAGSDRRLVNTPEYGFFNYGREGKNIRSEDVAAVATAWAAEQNRYDPPARLKAALLREVIGNPFRPVTLPRPVCPACRGEGREHGFGLTDYSRVCRTCGTGEAYRGSGLLPCPWLTPTMLSLAEAAYEHRNDRGHLDPSRLAVLADALEEAGCDNEEVLHHLRGRERCHKCLGTVRNDIGHPGGPIHCAFCSNGWVPLSGPHVRGCAALDTLLGKS